MNLSSDVFIALFNAFLQLFPLVITQWRWPFAPRQVTDGRELLPLLLAPWSAPSHITPGVIFSRLIQAGLLIARIPPDFNLVAYPLWIVLGLVRTQIGFLLTRSVGWAFPHLFKHWALYEETSGLGPAIVIYFYMLGVPEGIPIEERQFLVLLVVLLGWLDNTPWTYGIAVIIGLTLAVICRVALTEQRLLPTQAANATSKPNHTALLYHVGLASLLLLTVPYGIFNLFAPISSVPVSSLDIIILSSPQPGPDSDSFLSTTIASYIPHLTEQITLSVFTHANGYAAFLAAQATFADLVTFHADADQHPIEQWGHYLHLSEALKWADSKGEWILLIEDDFPLCPGGWNAIERVMAALNPGQSAFVGTGGSGLILHRSQLQILSDLLKLHAQNPVEWRKSPDVVMQDCMLGVGGLCRGILDADGLGRGLGGGDAGGMIITSRLVLDHIGGIDSIGKGKNGNTGCGWRHTLHGRRGVEVVVV